jgi:hypothetical protein
MQCHLVDCVCVQVRDLLVPLVQPWVPLICSALASDPTAQATWPAKLAALRLGHAIASYFCKPLAAVMPQLMGASWQLLLALQVGGLAGVWLCKGSTGTRTQGCGQHTSLRMTRQWRLLAAAVTAGRPQRSFHCRAPLGLAGCFNGCHVC